jgi:hypothetical protein
LTNRGAFKQKLVDGPAKRNVNLTSMNLRRNFARPTDLAKRYVDRDISRAPFSRQIDGAAFQRRKRAEFESPLMRGA